MDKSEISSLLIMGLASQLVGARGAAFKLNSYVAELERQLAELKQGKAPEDVIGVEGVRLIIGEAMPAKGKGRPPGRRSGSSYGWPADPEERRKEMARRIAVARGNAPSVRSAKGKPMHPRDSRHPGHAAWLKNVTKAAKKRWDSMSDTEKEARLDKMQAGRTKAPVVKLEKAS